MLRELWTPLEIAPLIILAANERREVVLGLCERIVREREERKRGRGHLSGRDEDTGSTVFPRRAESTSGDQSQDQRRTDLGRINIYLRYGVTNRWEAAHLATLRKKYPDEYWDLRYGRL